MQDTDNATCGGLDNEDRLMVEEQVYECDDGGDDEESLSSSNGADETRLFDKWSNLSPEVNSALTRLASRFCDACQNLCRGEMKVVNFERGWEQAGELPYHPSLSSLSESVHAGCPLCKEMLDCFVERLNTHCDVRDRVTNSWYITCSIRGGSRFPLLRHYWSKMLCFEFFFYDSNGQCVNTQIGGTIAKTFYTAEEFVLGPEYLEYAHEATKRVHVPNIALAKLWFDECLGQCDHRDEATSKFLPSRLIEVRTGGDTSRGLVARLCEAELFTADASYLTLSHCWGGNIIFTLTGGNIEALRQDIPIHQLPVLFQDALYVTRQLGVQFIWIDCLCILQDSRDDWEYEAARMGDVYRYAACNIAASGYKDGKASILKERTPLPFLNFPLCMDRTLVTRSNETTTKPRMLLKGIYVRLDIREFEYAVEEGPLNSRGWVAQERALSPGILHFTPKQMWWECKDHVCSESLPHTNFFLSSLNVLHIDPENVTGRSSFWQWNNFVAFYAGTDLTIWTDRFPALIGIARRFATLTGDNLVAGFWESDLMRSLSWKVYDKDRAKRVLKEQLAPSWSWACLCIPHENEWPLHDDTNVFSVVRRVVSDDPGFRSDLQYRSIRRSAVRGLEVTGPLRKLPVKIEKLEELPEWMDYDVEVLVYYDVADKSLFSATDLADETWHWLWEEPTHILPLFHDERFSISLWDLWMTCLLLTRVTGLEHQNTFRRVGVVQIRFKDQDTRNKALGMGDGNEDPNPRTVFEDCGTHDIILI